VQTTKAPPTTAQRQAQRDQIRQTVLDRAEIQARVVGRSMKCGAGLGMYEGWKHADEPDGCANDGSTCICECHDPKE
jgi:hypothetical protein